MGLPVRVGDRLQLILREARELVEADMDTGNMLFYGDNLDVLRRHLDSESVDLIYLDPPFNSNASYNALFAASHGRLAASQIKAFDDTWSWDENAAKAFEETIEADAGGAISRTLQALRQVLGDCDMLAYIAMMAPRIVELRRVLKQSGTIYLHCDPTASHYLKVLLDAIFGGGNFRNEIIWRRSHPKGLAFTRFASNHDVILAYAKVRGCETWNPAYKPHDPEQVEKQYRKQDDDGRRYQLTSLLNPNPNRPHLTYEFKGVTRVWRWTKQRMLDEDAKGNIVVPRGGKGIPRFKRYLDEQEGIPIDDVWTDIPIAAGDERLGYPTQKPLALLRRIIEASSKPSDVVLDPFCGCGTAVHAAQELGRRWIGIDVTHLAISEIKARLTRAFPPAALAYKTTGEPTSVPDAEQLAATDEYQFQFWALGLVGARKREAKKGADKGIDGQLVFHDEPVGGKSKHIIISVKAGKNIGVSYVRDLRGVIEREKAAIGVLISMHEPTKPMIAEATSAGFYESPWGTKHSRIQILRIEELLGGKSIDYPSFRGVNVTHMAATHNPAAPTSAAKNKRKKASGRATTKQQDRGLFD
jgi:site-specific DNA-methyltransferase (adenine-specific)